MSSRCATLSSAASLECRASRCLAVRASDRSKSNKSIIFYGGSTYTDDEWAEAFGSGHFKSPPCISPSEVPPPSGDVPTISSLFAFDGAAPELINGRLAMTGILAAVAAEVASGEGVIMQLSDAPGAVLVTFSLVAMASLIPLFQGREPESLCMGPLNAAAERLIGRAAMMGLLFLTVSEHFTGGKALL